MCKITLDYNAIDWKEHFELDSDSPSGETAFYLLVPGKTLGEVQENIPAFLENILQVFNIKKDPADLEVISDMLVY